MTKTNLKHHDDQSLLIRDPCNVKEIKPCLGRFHRSNISYPRSSLEILRGRELSFKTIIIKTLAFETSPLEMSKDLPWSRSALI